MKNSFIFLMLVIISLTPAVTHASWWNPFSWFKNKDAAPIVQQIETATTSIPAKIENKKVSVPKQGIETNILNLPNGSVVEIDSDGNILRYIKEVVRESAPQSDNYFSSQIDVLTKRLNLLEQELNGRLVGVINTPALPSMVGTLNISDVVVPEAIFSPEITSDKDSVKNDGIDRALITIKTKLSDGQIIPYKRIKLSMESNDNSYNLEYTSDSNGIISFLTFPTRGWCPANDSIIIRVNGEKNYAKVISVTRGPIPPNQKLFCP